MAAKRITRRHLGQALDVTHTDYNERFTLTVSRVTRADIEGTYTWEGKEYEGLFSRACLIINE